jgi:hypothetical protein
VPDFIPGLTLAERFYREAVRPILDAEFPRLRHSSALIGSGSEVLGFDTAVSSDHHWGPRVLLFLDEAEHPRHAAQIRASLRERLPHTFLGWPTNFAEPDPLDHGTQLLQATTSGPVNHRVEVLTLRGFFLEYLGFDLRDALEPADWLTFPAQKLRAITGGAVFHDALGLEELRSSFAWYPHAVWLWLMAAGWKRISQEEHLMGRAGQVGDEIGSALIAARLVGDAVRLCFLMERQYAPYPKWFGTAFAHLNAAHALSPLLAGVLRAETWPDRDRLLAEVYSLLAQKHNALGVTDPVSTDARTFFGRPFTVIFGERFTDALKARIDHPRVQRIPFDIGGIDQWSDSTDLVGATALRQRLKALYEAAEP